MVVSGVLAEFMSLWICFMCNFFVGNQPTRLVSILCWGSMIQVKTWLELVFKFYIGPPYVRVVSGVLAEFMSLWICFMCTFFVTMEGGRYLIRSTVSLVHVEKWPFLMARSKVFFGQV